MNIMAAITIIILAYHIFRGYKRGLVRTLFSTFSFIIAMVVASNVAPVVSEAWQSTNYHQELCDQIETTLFQSHDNDNNNGTAGLIDSLPVPDMVKTALTDNDNSQIYEILGVNDFKAYVAAYIAGLIVRALSFLLVYIATSIILRFIARGLDLLTRLPGLRSLNKAGGVLFGIANGMIVIWLIGLVLTLLGGTELGATLYSQVTGNPILSLIYDYNFILSLIIQMFI